jgi:hypothetical protein
VVLVDDDAAPGRIAEIVSDGSIRLALDGVGGAATARLAKTLSQHGELVGYAYMVGYSAPRSSEISWTRILPFTASIMSDRIMTPKSLVWREISAFKKASFQVS